MIIRTEAQQEALKAELGEGVKYHKFDDLVTVEGTGVFEDLKKDVKYPRVHRLVAEKLRDKGYAKIV